MFGATFLALSLVLAEF